MSSVIDPSRRNWMRRMMLLKPEEAQPERLDADVARKAIIQGRHCLAYQRSFCSTCVERCPVEGAIQVQNGIPQVLASACTGCGICHAVCPAPTNAILMRPMGGKVRHV